MNNAKSDDAEFHEQYREEQKKRRAERLPIRVEEIYNLAKYGYTVTKITEYQYRINDLIDIYPTHHRYHILKLRKRGDYKPNELLDCLNHIDKILKP